MRAPVDPDLARTLDSVAGLRRVSITPAFDLWRLGRLPDRVSVVEPSGAVVAVPSGQLGVSGADAPAAGGILTVSEPAGDWHASLNGRPLTAVASPAGGWAQAFRLPSGGGTVQVSRSDLTHGLSIGFELLVVLVVAALALPGVRTAAEAQLAAAGAGAPAGAGVPAGGSDNEREGAASGAAGRPGSRAGARAAPRPVAGAPGTGAGSPERISRWPGRAAFARSPAAERPGT